MHLFIGSLGHLLIIASFVSSMASAYGYFQAVNAGLEEEKQSWLKMARGIFYAHSLFVVGVVVVLFFIINKGYFEYHYAYSHSSSVLPAYYQISSFWEGQEGSFLLWIFWNMLLGLVLIQTNKYWEASVMSIFGGVQAFLLSMILGVMIFDIKIGSSPFILLRDALDAPIFKTNPDYIPEDGKGLNPLLQNYWMVIHPPTLFLGFATTLIPFAYCMAGLWVGKYKEWIKPALPWALFSAVVLGVGILMGAYWAYETLNFGGFWNWDPVENAVYVPWLVLIAAIHLMIAFKKSTAALKGAIILTLSCFVLIVYSTFLTRSGVLGDSSVHAFTDLGLYGQLVSYLAFFVFASIFFIIRTWKQLESDEKEVSTYSREFWIFMGATVLCLMGFQVIVPTSIPVWNEIMYQLGVSSNIAPPVDQVIYYTKFQIWGGVLLAVLSGTGQFFWWNKMNPKKLREELIIPILITLVISMVVIISSKMTEIRFIILLVAALYSIISNGKILLERMKNNFNLAGGAVAHIGIALMLLGILFSAGYSNIISVNYTGLVWSKDFPDEINQKNLLLFQNDPRQMGNYVLNYRGKTKRIKDYDGYVPAHHFWQYNETHAELISDYYVQGELVFAQGDTVEFHNPETSYFKIDYEKNGQQAFTLYPTVQINEKMNMTVMSPDIKHSIDYDLYTHVRTFPDPKSETIWSEMEEMEVMIGKAFFVNDFVATLEKIERIPHVSGVNLSEGDVAVEATVAIQGSEKTYKAKPIYIIKDGRIGRIPDTVHDLATKVTLLNIDPNKGAFSLGINTTQKDWVILEAKEMPLINLLWIGTIVIALGFVIAIRRRYREFRLMKLKGLEV